MAYPFIIFYNPMKVTMFHGNPNPMTDPYVNGRLMLT